LLFFGSERVCTETASEQPTGYSSLTSKAEEEGFKVSRLQRIHLCSTLYSFCPSFTVHFCQISLHQSSHLA